MSDQRQWGVVLGGSTGIGALIAERFADVPGLNVLGLHRGNWPDDAAALAARIETRGVACEMHVADASCWETAEATADRLLEAHGPGSVKALVHSIASASVGVFTGSDRVHPRQIQATFERMSHSLVYWAQAFESRGLLAPSASIVGLTNLMPDAVVRGAGLVAATKAALEIYMRYLSFELAPRGHRVNLVKFGLVVTPAVRQTFPDDRIELLEATMKRATFSRQLTEPEDVARFVSWLVSDEGRVFNGSTIDLTCGEGLSFFDSLIYPEHA